MSEERDKLEQLLRDPNIFIVDKNPNLRRRVSLRLLQEAREKYNNPGPLDKVIRAWQGVQQKSIDNPEDPDGYFVIAGYHGEPFHGPGRKDTSNYWGGYCNHGNILFPTWHRAYLWRLEEALRKIKGCEDVTIPFWDEFAAYLGDFRIPDDPLNPPKRDSPIPTVLTDDEYTFSDTKETIRNPLKSYTFPLSLSDAQGQQDRYAKPKGYTTVRYPLSGLVGPYDKRMTDLYNTSFKKDTLTKILNNNVMSWINAGPQIYGDKANTPQADSLSVGKRLENCLNAPNYMVFSNKTSSNQWVEDHGLTGEDAQSLQSLESPHNAIHLALGGIYLASEYNADQEAGYNANGDMGENNTASMDPIFFFHHCFVDYVFHLWQKKNGMTQRNSLKVEMGYAGTNSSDSGGAPVFQPLNTFLHMDTPLYPFTKNEGSGYKPAVESGPGVWVTSNDVTDIEELGYCYGLGSMDPLIKKSKMMFGEGPPLLGAKRISGINRMDYGGSFVVRTYAVGPDGKKVEVARDEVLSRWNIEGCRNCQNTLDVKTFAPITKPMAVFLQGDNPMWQKEEYQKHLYAALNYEVTVQGHGAEENKVDANITDLWIP